MTIFCSECPRIILGLSSNRLSFGGCTSGSFRISWQGQYLVRLEGDFACSVHCKRRFICQADQCLDSFCVAGAIFGEVGV